MLGSVALPTPSAGIMSSLFFLLSFIVVNGSVIKLRRERPDMNRPYEMPYYPIPPILGIALNLILTGVLIEYLLRTDVLALVLSAGWILLGIAAYAVYTRLGSSDEPSEATDADEPIPQTDD
jgi:amino acid transporter